MSLDADSLAVSNPIEIHLIVVEHLGDDDICSSITFFLEMFDVVLSAGGLEMGLWVSSNDDAEVVTIFLFDEGDELSGISKSVLDWGPAFLSLWWISSKSQDILDAVFLGSVESLDHSISGHASASEMHKAVHTHVSLDLSAEIEGCTE